MGLVSHDQIQRRDDVGRVSKPIQTKLQHQHVPRYTSASEHKIRFICHKLVNFRNYQKFLSLGDSVYGIILTVNYSEPINFISVMGESCTLEEFVNASFNCVGMFGLEKALKIDQPLVSHTVDVLVVGYSPKSHKILG